ncbi:MAG TPA: PspC domain-containing protein [Longimicrobiaceae bacterium]|jgi:phage shock protein PspC (stress-responsive transcriptional regulator)|nr:PspC domain-containing protein [Longimicrobiaceae bacterium]
MKETPNRLTRSHDRVLAGVLGGIAERLGWAPSGLRIGYIILSALSAAFPGILLYLILWAIMPKAPPSNGPFNLNDFRVQ